MACITFLRDQGGVCGWLSKQGQTKCTGRPCLKKQNAAGFIGIQNKFIFLSSQIISLPADAVTEATNRNASNTMIETRRYLSIISCAEFNSLCPLLY